MSESHKDELASKEVTCLEIVGDMAKLRETVALREQLLQDKITQLEEQNLELQKTAKSLIVDFIELDEAFEALVKEMQILKAKYSKRSNDGGHAGASQHYRKWYCYY